MREMEQMALSYLGRNPILCMDMVEALRRGDGVVSAVRTDGVLISIPRSGAYLLAAGDTAAAEALGGLIRGARQLAVHDKDNAQLLRDELRERLAARAVYGVLHRREPEGIVGIYPEGGVGMLAVRQDLEEQAAMELLGGLVAYITGWCLDKCLAPFVHIPVEDGLLLSVYEQAGYTVCEKNMYWLG